MYCEHIKDWRMLSRNNIFITSWDHLLNCTFDAVKHPRRSIHTGMISGWNYAAYVYTEKRSSFQLGGYQNIKVTKNSVREGSLNLFPQHRHGVSFLKMKDIVCLRRRKNMHTFEYKLRQFRYFCFLMVISFWWKKYNVLSIPVFY